MPESDKLSRPVWCPPQQYIDGCNLTHFVSKVEKRHGLTFAQDYSLLHDWSVNDDSTFWREIIQQFDICHSGEIDPPYVSINEPPGRRWFPQLKLNYAENLLRWPDQWTAIIEADENGIGRHWSFAELRERVSRHQQALLCAGVSAGDCVAGILSNTAEATAAMLAATSIGAVWSSVSPDFGKAAALDRLDQIEPVVLYVSGSYCYNGKQFDVHEAIADIVAALPSVKKVVQLVEGWAVSASQREISLVEFLAKTANMPPTFLHLPFNHPLFVLFTSGTTGAPKGIVHGHGGTLLQLLKEHRLHCDVRPEDKLVFPTTLGWMMWNWLVSALGSGATIVLYDGAPMAPNENSLFSLADELDVTLLGLPGAFVEHCRKKDLQPNKSFKFDKLRMLFVGGSILSPEGFDYAYASIAADVHLASGSGGTDIVSCFMLGNPWAPVWAGEIQAPALGMEMQIFNEAGKPVVGERGELVCINRTPSMPLRFINDLDSKRFRKAYFDAFPDVWTHGDFAECTQHGGYIIYGRSDSVLNPGGVRIGTAEIYRQLQTIPDIIESVVVGQKIDSDIQVVLFVILGEGLQLDDELQQQIRQVLRENASPRHVPRVIIQVPDIPRTRSNKISESAVSAVINGQPPPQLHALANPDSIKYFRPLPDVQQ